MSYAKTTKVPIARTREHIHQIVTKHGADSFATMDRAGKAQIAFSIGERNILFRCEIPDTGQKARSRWRALFLVIKAKLEGVSSGIETIEEAFLANIVMPDGRTVMEHTAPAIESHYQGSGNEIPLLPHHH